MEDEEYVCCRHTELEETSNTATIVLKYFSPYKAEFSGDFRF